MEDEVEAQRKLEEVRKQMEQMEIIAKLKADQEARNKVIEEAKEDVEMADCDRTETEIFSDKSRADSKAMAAKTPLTASKSKVTPELTNTLLQ